MAPVTTSRRLAFELPPELEAAAPAEARGMTRDAVRMMVAYRHDPKLVHSTFALLPAFLEPGDLVVVNTSGTIPAAIDAVGDGGTPVVVHLSTALDDGRWVVEPRRPDGRALPAPGAVGAGPLGPRSLLGGIPAPRRSLTTQRWTGPVPPPRALTLAGGASLVLDEPYGDAGRLWVATLELPQPVLTWLAVHGRPIRYAHVDRAWPLSAYQNVYVTEPGSAEMPSAGRPFTHEVLTRLAAKGVGVSPIVLHTGVASLEADELPYPERVRVPSVTAHRINAAHADGCRVVAIGTTVVRAIETAADPEGVVRAYDGWTDVVITPERGVRAVDGLLTGWHEPEASHLLMLEAVAGRELLERSYEASLAEGYLWHEFGDVHLILP
jgi:S-adenosylmethionine:tRNA ribosyltransferase-isomerase